MVNKQVFFDANIYRELFRNKSQFQIKLESHNIIQKQKRKQIQSTIHIYTLLELLYHLYNKNDSSFQDCYNAIIAINYLCRDDKTKVLYYIKDIDSTIIERLLKGSVNKIYMMYEVITTCCAYIFEHKSTFNISRIKTELKNIHETVEEVESAYKDKYKKYITNLDTNSTDWRLYRNDKKSRHNYLKYLKSKDIMLGISKLKLFDCAEIAELSIDKNDIEKYSKTILENSRMLVLIEIEILKRIVESGFDFSKKNRVNWFWDWQIASCIYTGPTDRIDEMFITNDRGLLDIASKNELNDKIMNLNNYLKWLDT